MLATGAATTKTSTGTDTERSFCASISITSSVVYGAGRSASPDGDADTGSSSSQFPLRREVPRSIDGSWIVACSTCSVIHDGSSSATRQTGGPASGSEPRR